MELRIEITGTAPLLMHAPTLVDPLHPHTKEIKRITSKTPRAVVDEDHIAKYRLQFEAGMYFDPDQGPYLPGENIAKSLLEAARLSRSGKKVERGLILVSPVNALAYEGPRDVSGLWSDLRFRRTMPVNGNPSRGNKSMVMACRPIFQNWSVTASILVNPSVISADDLQRTADAAGQMIGVGDWRPWHGRFTAKVTS